LYSSPNIIREIKSRRMRCIAWKTEMQMGIIFKWMIKKYAPRMWTAIIWLRIGFSGGFF
jgi:hypothetical protein